MTSTLIGLPAVILLVLANGFFVAAEFSLVAVRRSRVVELVDQGRVNARILERTVGRLDASLAATQLGITLSSLALGWVGEPALAHLIKPILEGWAGRYIGLGADAIAIVIAFSVITALHIVLGELAPKSLALQRTESTALWVVRPLNLFQFVFRPVIILLNGLGNLVLRLIGLHPGANEESLHSPEELKSLVAASQKAGLLQQAQQEVVEHVLTIGERRVGDIMTPRTTIDWLDPNDSRTEMLHILRSSQHEQLLVMRSDNDEFLGMVLKQDMLNQAIDGQQLDPMTLLQWPLVIPESTSILKALELFRTMPVRIAAVFDEYGSLEGMVTATDLLTAVAGHLPETGDSPEIETQDDGSLLINGASPVYQVFNRLGLRDPKGSYHTAAGFVLAQLEHLPHRGEQFYYKGWYFEVAEMNKRRITRIRVTYDITSAISGDGPASNGD